MLIRRYFSSQACQIVTETRSGRVGDRWRGEWRPADRHWPVRNLGRHALHLVLRRIGTSAEEA